MKIYKYPLPPKRGIFRIKAKQIVKILHVEGINGVFPCFWAAVDEEKDWDYNIHSIHTGEDALAHEFLGTVVLDGGDYVLHYFLERNPL